MRIAMILAAGRGERMRPLTDHCPKVLLPVLGKPLLFHHIDKLDAEKFDRIIINTAYLADKIYDAIKKELQKNRWQSEICIVEEKPQALETAGGIVNALPFLSTDVFTLISGDIFTDFKFNEIKLAQDTLAHLILVDNPTYHLEGDFVLENGFVKKKQSVNFTYANIGIFKTSIFQSLAPGFRPLKSVLDVLIAKNAVSGEYYNGNWHNVGRPSDLELLTLSPV